jgi:hypothetical protein
MKKPKIELTDEWSFHISVTPKGGESMYPSEIQEAYKAMIEALIEIMKVHRHVYGLDGAWDKELKQAEQALTKAGVKL